MKKLPRTFYARNTVEVARELLGKYLIHIEGEIQKIGKIVEVEAYIGEEDLAAHSSKGLTKRTQVMYGPAGHAYVYLIYGIHHCVNVVTEREGIGSAVLIRALEPIANITEKTRGPGLLCKAMNIDLRLNKTDLCENSLYIAQSSEHQTFDIIATPRIGVAYAKEWADKPLRFYIAGNPFVSR